MTQTNADKRRFVLLIYTQNKSAKICVVSVICVQYIHYVTFSYEQ